MTVYNFAEKFCKAPGPRTENIGPCSGEKFRVEVLEKWFEAGDPIEIDVSDTVLNFGPSFLSEAFGKIAIKFGEKRFYEIIHVSDKGNRNKKLKELIIKHVTIALSKSK
ncbi:MAG: hypothetical protein C0627_05130 [Sulfurimonas sp.]|nr:MAG: hypothetical protein C0627_05130 [Sulfurimonas sp.]